MLEIKWPRGVCCRQDPIMNQNLSAVSALSCTQGLPSNNTHIYRTTNQTLCQAVFVHRFLFLHLKRKLTELHGLMQNVSTKGFTDIQDLEDNTQKTGPSSLVLTVPYRLPVTPSSEVLENLKQCPRR